MQQCAFIRSICYVWAPRVLILLIQYCVCQAIHNYVPRNLYASEASINRKSRFSTHQVHMHRPKICVNISDSITPSSPNAKSNLPGGARKQDAIINCCRQQCREERAEAWNLGSEYSRNQKTVFCLKQYLASNMCIMPKCT